MGTKYRINDTTVEINCERTWECPSCDKAFARKGDLTRHKKLHSGHRQFECPYERCEKAFHQSTGLTNHIRIHTGEKPFHCGVGACKKVFSDPSSRLRHKSEVHCNNPFDCPFDQCTTSIKRASSFREHLRKKHGLKGDTVDIELCRRQSQCRPQLDISCSSTQRSGSGQSQLSFSGSHAAPGAPSIDHGQNISDLTTYSHSPILNFESELLSLPIQQLMPFNEPYSSVLESPHVISPSFFSTNNSLLQEVNLIRLDTRLTGPGVPGNLNSIFA